MIRALIIFAVLLVGLDAHAQEAKKPIWSFGANPYYGGVLRYKPNMPKLKLTNLYGIELYANKMTNGNKAWQSIFNYPQVGHAFEYYNYGDPDELGEVYSLSSYLDFTTSKDKKGQFRFNIGTGLVYSTRTFDEETNPENKAVSSTISYILRGTMHYEVQLNPNYYINFNAAFRHYSNGKLNMPNNGMNFPAIGVGLRYVPNPGNLTFYKDTTTRIDPKLKFNLMASRSWREVWREDFKHTAYSASFYVSKQVTRFNSALLGVDGFWYDRESMKRAHSTWKAGDPSVPEDFEPDLDGRQLAITAGTEILLGKMIVIVQGGYYLFKPQKIYDATWYQRYGLKYYPLKNAFGQITLKAHSRTADMVEFGVGVTL
ncbi:hypothetical protein E1176_15410 [Fulvivirga sp. RKSG066]|uniref:acyloxyacyl hydrolase n=1 Tax=Fulvivirga aurantia TaxID=2529383 RepID=UPI0012BC589D|nr:acyloxyacyl hydrolase [Fulvivirga aurantia]MTI22419.1 hypothetical protein [Fulvivirga aurantia]